MVLNRSARSVIEAQRGKHGCYVFAFKGGRLGGMDNNGWRKPWQEVGLPIKDDCRCGPHNFNIPVVGVCAQPMLV